MSDFNQKQPKKDGRGGPRPGSGRPKGAKDRVSVSGILESLNNKTNGQSYEDILIEDFINARQDGDSNLVLKYHTLLANKFVANLNDIVIEDASESVKVKEMAFQQAISAIMSINKGKEE
jgi:hypothetical protein